MCPQCYSEFPWPKVVCPRCHVRLDKAAPDSNIELVSVFTTCDGGALAIATSVLEAEGIAYSVPDGDLRNLIGVGQLGVNLVLEPVDILVRKEAADRARELLRPLTLQTS